MKVTQMFIRNSRTISFQRIVRRLATTGDTGQKLADEAAARYVQRGQAEMTRQYRRLLDEIGGVLEDPAGAGLNRPDVGGSRIVDVTDAEGRDLEVRLPAWDPLTPNYMRKAPTSVQFWKKSDPGRPLGGRPRSLSATFKAAVSNVGQVRVVPGRLVEQAVGDRSRYVMRLRFELPALPAPLDIAINQSFVKGEVSQTLHLSQTYDRNSIGVIAYPEHFRPLLSHISAAFSQRVVTGLKKATTGLNR